MIAGTLVCTDGKIVNERVELAIGKAPAKKAVAKKAPAKKSTAKKSTAKKAVSKEAAPAPESDGAAPSADSEEKEG